MCVKYLKTWSNRESYSLAHSLGNIQGHEGSFSLVTNEKIPRSLQEEMTAGLLVLLRNMG